MSDPDRPDAHPHRDRPDRPAHAAEPVDPEHSVLWPFRPRAERQPRGSALDDPARLESLARLALDPTPDLPLDRFTALVRRLLDVPVALVSLVEADRQIFPGLSGLDGELADARQTPLSHSFCQHVVTSGAPLVIPDARTDPRVAGNAAITELGVIAYAGVPLTDTNGYVLGSLCAIDTVPRQWTQHDIQILDDLRAAVSAELRLRITVDELTRARDESSVSRQRAETAQIDAARLRDNAELAARRLELLSEVGEVLTSTLDAELAVGRLAPLLVPMLADWCVITLVDEHGRRRDTGRAHRDPAMLAAVVDYARHHARVTERAPSSIALRTGEPVVVELRPALVEQGHADAAATDALRRLDAGSVAAFPLQARGRTMGVLSLVNSVGRGTQSPSEHAISAEVARRVGVALDNAQLYAQQRRMAETLQLSLLSPPPAAAGLVVEVRYRPATVDAHVGGDWYDAFNQEDGATVVVIGDVIGHDVAATAAMSQLRSLVRGIAFDRDDGPAGVLRRVDRAVQGLKIGTMATAMIVQLTPTAEGCTVRWSSAGHPPPLVAGPDGRVRLLYEPSDLLLGVDASARRREHQVALPRGSTLLVCTDGLFERPELDIDVTLQDLADTVAGLAPSAATDLGAFCDALLERQVGANGRDDAALVAVHVRGPAVLGSAAAESSGCLSIAEPSESLFTATTEPIGA